MSRPRIALQTYSVQQPLDDDAERALSRLAAAGYRNLEPTSSFLTSDLAARARGLGFEFPTAHAGYVSDRIVTPDGTVYELPDPDTTFAAAQASGVRYVIDPYVPPTEWETRAGIEATAQRINSLAAGAASRGLRLGYHNHAHEIASKVEGRHALEVLAECLDESVVLEVDLFWAAVAGAEVPSLVDRLESRVVAVHIKDGKLGGENPLGCQCPAGKGDVPLAESLDAARHLEYAVVEFDAGYQGDVIDAVTESYQFLADRGLS